MKTVLIIGQITVNQGLLEGHKSIDILQVRALSIVVLTDLTKLRERCLKRQATLDINRRLCFIEEKVDFISVCKRCPESSVFQRSLRRLNQSSITNIIITSSMERLLVYGRLNCVASTVNEIDGIVVDAEGNRLLCILVVIRINSTERGELWLFKLVLQLEYIR